MKLYIYDHCPFYVRAHMIFGLRGVEVKNIILANDDEDTPIDMIGAKQVPILERDDGTFMSESLDIVHYINGTTGKGRLKAEVRPELQAWLDKVDEYNNHLTQPHLVKIGLPEFATKSAVRYFIDKKERDVSNFETDLNETAQYPEQLNQDLIQLETLTAPGPDSIGGEVGVEDILTFPILHNLTVVRDVQWPAKIVDYLARTNAQSGVPLYFDRTL